MCDHLSVTTNISTKYCLRYLCNLCFSDVLDPSTNRVFPARQHVALTASLLPQVVGQASTHLIYKPTEIWPWIHGFSRTPPQLLNLDTESDNEMRSTVRSVNVSQADFSDPWLAGLDFTFSVEGGGLDFVSPINCLLSVVDFSL